MKTSDFAEEISNPSTPFREFTEESKASFVSVWEQRLSDSIHFQQTDLEVRSKRILDFISEAKSASPLRLYILAEQKITFLYNSETNGCCEITEKAEQDA